MPVFLFPESFFFYVLNLLQSIKADFMTIKCVILGLCWFEGSVKWSIIHSFFDGLLSNQIHDLVLCVTACSVIFVACVLYNAPELVPSFPSRDFSELEVSSLQVWHDSTHGVYMKW